MDKRIAGPRYEKATEREYRLEREVKCETGLLGFLAFKNTAFCFFLSSGSNTNEHVSVKAKIQKCLLDPKSVFMSQKAYLLLIY